MTSGLVKEQNMEKQFEKQMGCMAGFLQIFDRHHILAGKRLYSAKRLPPSPVGKTNLESGKLVSASPAISGDLGKPLQPERVSTLSQQRPKKTPEVELQLPVADLPPKLPLPLPIFELKNGNQSSWKMSREVPRLSLDSRATTDAKGGLHSKSISNRGESLIDEITVGDQQHRSPSVIAKLMGLEPLPGKTPELRRSASESRVSKDLFQSRFVYDGANLHSKQQNQSHSAYFNNAHKDNASINAHCVDPSSNSLKKIVKAEGLKGGFVNSTTPWRAPQPCKSFFDSGDVFPEPRQTVSIYGEIEKRLRMRGIDEPAKDLETLKQILEALQLKGLLHCEHPSASQQNQLHHRNFVYDESPIVLMRSSASTPINHRLGNGNDYSPSNARNQTRRLGRSYSGTSPSPSPRRERSVRSPTRSGRSPSPTTRSNANPTRSNSPRQLNVETQRRVNEAPEKRKGSPVHSPKLSTRKTGLDRLGRTPKSKKATSEIHQKERSPTVENEYSSISGTDTEKSKGEECREGSKLLDRCDKLLHSIADMASTGMQPSPVSVLDSSFYKDEPLTPSPVTTKRNIDFRDQYDEQEEEILSPAISPIGFKRLETRDDCDFAYISDILRASHYLPEESDVFLLLEKQQHCKGNDTSKVSRLQRKLIFDTIGEILNRDKQLPPWKVSTTPLLDKVWSEFQRIREHGGGENLFETICSVLKKDLAGDGSNGWGDFRVEMSEAVLEIERLIFKDMISEIIGDLSALASSSSTTPRRKLVF